MLGEPQSWIRSPGVTWRQAQKGPEKGSSCIWLSFLPLVKYERIKFLVIALKSSVEVYAWAPKPYHKFMAFKVMSASAPMTRFQGLASPPVPLIPSLLHSPSLTSLTVLCWLT